MITAKDRARHYPLRLSHTPKAPKTQLERDIAAAATAGMSYGKYKALHPNTAPPKKEERPVPAPSDPITKPRAEPRETYTTTCAACGQTFETNNKRRKYCGPECKHKAELEAHRARKQPRAPVRKVCPVCGEEFLADHNQQVYCGIRCRYKANANPARRYDRG